MENYDVQATPTCPAVTSQQQLNKNKATSGQHPLENGGTNPWIPIPDEPVINPQLRAEPATPPVKKQLKQVNTVKESWKSFATHEI
jgi:hypothetical protein